MYLITGANGFIGKNLIGFLKQRGIPVRTVSRLKECSYPIEDFNDQINWSKALQGVKVVIHLASKVHDFDNENKNRWHEYLVTNVKATENLAKSAANAGVKRLIYLSSIKVNGEKTDYDKDFQDTLNDKPIGLYALSKFQAEKSLMQISSKTELELIIIRPSLVYGPGVKANFLKFLDIIHTGIPLPFGSIKNFRSLCYVYNLVDFIYHLSNIENVPKFPLLFADPYPLSTKEIIIIISRIFNKKVSLIPIPEFLLVLIFKFFRKYENYSKLIDSLRVDVDKSISSVNYKFKFNSKEGLENTAMWYLRKIVNKK